MKYLFFTGLIIIINSFSTQAQVGDTSLNQPAVKLPKEVFTPVEIMAEPRGGMDVFFQYINRNTMCPKSAKDNNIVGKVIVAFTVEKDGSLDDIKVDKSLSFDTDAEAIRLIKISPKWIPASQNGNPVRVRFKVPIQFPPNL
ncbi:hypothetical protein GCM10027037_08350 [Mucilaginibacter koreensis]